MEPSPSFSKIFAALHIKHFVVAHQRFNSIYQWTVFESITFETFDHSLNFISIALSNSCLFWCRASNVRIQSFFWTLLTVSRRHNRIVMVMTANNYIVQSFSYSLASPLVRKRLRTVAFCISRRPVDQVLFTVDEVIGFREHVETARPPRRSGQMSRCTWLRFLV